MNALCKPKSNQAQVASLIRAYLKKIGVPGRVRSEGFSMGDSVNVDIVDISPDVMSKIESFAKDYQAGSFDGMNDIYEYSNRRKDIPQTKYLFVNVTFTDELKQAAWSYILENYGLADSLEPVFKDVGFTQVMGVDPGSFVYRFLRGSSGEVIGINGPINYSKMFWDGRKVKNAEPIKTGSSFVITEHTHTKRGFQMFIVQLSERLSKDDFKSILDDVKAAGGWYTRQWGDTPGGFAFKEMETAQQFADSITGETAPDLVNGSTPKPNTHKAEKLRDIAERMQKDIDHKLDPNRQTNTPKRMREAGNARIDGHRLERTQSVLHSLADLHESGNIPLSIAGITSKKAVFDAMKSEVDYSGGYYDTGRDSGEPASDDPLTIELWALLTPITEEQQTANEIQTKVEALQFSNIAGYFPTPGPVIDIMLDYAQLESGHGVLEPSAGSGAIADRAKDLGCAVSCFEINHSLKSILELKDHYILGDDFMQSEIMVESRYDRVLMNPPFENLQDVDHVLRAFDALKDGGRLVSVMSPSAFFRADQKSTAFRNWFEENGGEKIELPDQSFKASGTNISTCLVVLDRND